MLLISCAAPRTPPAQPPPTQPVAPAPNPVDECPRRTMGVTPEVVVVKSLAAAKAHLAAIAEAANEDLDQLAADHGKAFTVRVLRGTFHGSDSFLYDIGAVFIMDKNVVVAKRLAIEASVIPGPDGAPKPMQTKVEFLSPTIGHIQLDGGDTVTDHFIDLEHGKHLLALESSSPRTWTLDDPAIVSGDCREWWDD
jgi:hypothetical protein